MTGGCWEWQRGCREWQRGCREWQRGCRAGREGRRAVGWIPVSLLLSFPQVFSGNPSSGESKGCGNDGMYRMTGKRKDSGFPIKNVGNDSGGMLGMTEVDVGNDRSGCWEWQRGCWEWQRGCRAGREGRRAVGWIPVSLLLSFPQVFSGNPSSGESKGFGNDRMYRMTGKRKDSGFPIKDVGNDRGGMSGMTEVDVGNDKGGMLGMAAGGRE